MGQMSAFVPVFMPQAFIVRHLPMLVFGRKEGGPVAVAAAEASAAASPVERAAPAGELLCSMQVTGAGHARRVVLGHPGSPGVNALLRSRTATLSATITLGCTSAPDPQAKGPVANGPYARPSSRIAR